MTDTLTTLELSELAQHEAVIAQGLRTFVDVGAALLAIRDARLYRTEWATFETYCRERWNMSRVHAFRLIEAAAVTENLLPIGNTLPTTESQARPLTALEPEQQAVAWQRAVDTAPEGKVTAAHVQAVVDDMRKPQTTRPENLHISDDSYEWFTPAEYIATARRVMGSIDTDPATCQEANQIIQASVIYTAHDNGLLHNWPGNVWLNPPYNMPWIERFVDKAIAEYARDSARSVMVLTNNSTDTAWFHKLLRLAPVCLTRGRIRFWGADGDTLATRQGQAIFYLGKHVGLFKAEFSTFGAVVSL